MKIDNVLVPVDFSPPSRLAVNYGVSLARIFRARLTLMHVVESPPALPQPFPAQSPKIEKEHREQAARMLSALLSPEDQDDLDLQVVIKSGNIKDEIVSAIRERHADIAVMGTHGRGLFGRLLIGSITEGILRKISIPILTISKATHPMSVKRILFATDLSESSKQGFGFALNLAQRMRAGMTVLHVLEMVPLAHGGPEMAGYVSERHLETARAAVSELIAEADKQSVRIETLVVEGVVAEEILKAADESEADLILITVKSKGLVERALLGTTAERVVRDAQVPVLSVPANELVL